MINPLHNRLRGTDRLKLLAITLVVFLPGVFTLSLTDRDEGWYAQVSREMVDSGDWLVPRYLGEPWLAKPPLLYWCVSTSFTLLGKSAGAARLISVLATVVTVQLLATLAVRIFNRRTAMYAAITYVTLALPAIVGRMVLTDALLLACCLAAMCVLWDVARVRANWTRCALFWCLVGLGVLAKGPAVFVFVGAFALGLFVSTPSRAWLRSVALWCTLPLAVVVSGWWYVYVGLYAGETLVDQFIGYEILSRLTSAPHGHGGPPGFYLILSLAGCLPWTPLVPGAVFELWRGRKTDPAAWLMLIWCFAPWLFLELLPSKLAHYILPCYVPLAIIVGRMWGVGLGRAIARPQWTVLGIWVGCNLLLGLGFVHLAYAFGSYAWQWGALACGLTLLIGFAIAGWSVAREQLVRAWSQAVVVAGIFYIVFFEGFLGGFEPYRLSRRIADAANEVSPPGGAVFVHGYTEPTMFFYFDADARVVKPEELERAVGSASRGTAFVIAEPALVETGLVELATREWRELEGMNYVKGEPMIVWVGGAPHAAVQP